MKKKELANLIDEAYRRCGDKKTVILADRLKDLGYYYATKAGISICVDDMTIPESKKEIIEKAREEVLEIQNQYKEGLITDGERYNKVIDIWARANEDISERMMNGPPDDDHKAARTARKEGRELQPDLHDGRLRRPRQHAANSPAGRNARSDGQAHRRDH